MDYPSWFPPLQWELPLTFLGRSSLESVQQWLNTSTVLVRRRKGWHCIACPCIHEVSRYFRKQHFGGQKCVTCLCLFDDCGSCVQHFYSLPRVYKSRDSSVGIALGCGLDDRSSTVRFPAAAGNFSVHHRVRNGSGAHPASYPSIVTRLWGGPPDFNSWQGQIRYFLLFATAFRPVLGPT
jgi:hypothetical protein